MESLDRQAFANVDEKGFVPEDVRNAFFRKLRMKTENRTCFECSARNPTWNSLSFGVYLCLECSGEHRRKGVHISYVRSVELDQFRPDQMVQMALGGNGKAWTYFKQHSMGKTSDTGRAVDYTSKIAVRYKEQLERETREACLKLKIERKGSTQVSSSADPIEEAPEVAAPVPTAEPEATNLRHRLSPRRRQKQHHPRQPLWFCAGLLLPNPIRPQHPPLRLRPLPHLHPMHPCSENQQGSPGQNIWPRSWTLTSISMNWRARQANPNLHLFQHRRQSLPLFRPRVRQSL